MYVIVCSRSWTRPRSIRAHKIAVHTAGPRTGLFSKGLKPHRSLQQHQNHAASSRRSHPSSVKMTHADLLRAFGAPQTSESRREALAALFSTLSPCEWRWARSVLAARSFQCDIIGCLPIELVARIFTYLDTSTPFLLQRVSSTGNRKTCTCVELTRRRSPDVGTLVCAACMF